MPIITEYLQHLPIIPYVMEVTPTGVLEVIYLGESFTRLTGYPPEAASTPAAWAERIHPDDQAAVAQYRRANAGAPTYSFEYRWRLADGNYRWFRDSGTVISGDDQHAQRVVGFRQDITERKAFEQELDDLNRRLGAALADSNISLYSQDRDLRYTWFYNIQRPPKVDDLKGRTAAEIVDAQQVGPWDAIKLQAMATGEPQREVLTYDGKFYEVQVKPIFDAKGEVDGTTTITLDVTPLKQAELDLSLKSRQLELSNAALEQFAYVASHDLQEPLRAVTGYLDLLSQMYTAQLDEQAQDFIHEAVEGANRMRSLIHGLLEFSRIGRSTIPREVTDLNECVRLALKNLEFALDESEAQIEIDSLSTAQVVSAQIVMLFQNLISNAIKFRHPDRTPIVHIGCEATATACKVMVRDNGIGIDPAYHRSIFGIFQRLHTREEYPGTGIGLALCQRIVEHHEGVIWVESILGEGTTFYFTLPK